MSSLALIPARGGSKRVPDKNRRVLAGHPLIAYTIRAAIDSKCFQKVLVSSDSKEILEIADRYGADCLRRPDDYATDTSPDIEWVRHALDVVGEPGGAYDDFAILRPTSPFRKAVTIQRAYKQWSDLKEAGHNFSSLRAVEEVSQHPGKMWRISGVEMSPLLLQPAAQPFHDSQKASLPTVWVQNASLEIASVDTVKTTGTISGVRITPFFTSAEEGFDINTLPDWEMASHLWQTGQYALPKMEVSRYVA